MNLSVEPKQIDLYEFLLESELSQYYSSIKNELKITAVHQLKYATDEDFKIIGMSRPEIRRLRKFYDKYYKFNYLSKIKRLLQNPVKRDEPMNPSAVVEVVKAPSSPSKIPNNKHIIPVDSISVNKQLGVGEFGIVQQGVWTNGNERIQVAIKCLCRERMQTNPMEFLKEAAIMHSIEHENIVRLYGVVLDTEALMLVTELAHLRSLLECLKDSDLRVSFLTVPTLCDFAMQICNGMLYLENKRLIHRDLAARNILVFSKNKVKISDFGLSRALGVGKDYYKTNFNVNLKLPIAWCAPECINFLKFTNASDVWAFAVTLWEMFSYGFQPWAAMTGHQILEAIDKPNFQRLEQPECCSKEYYALMLKCWNHDPLKRPKFSEIYQALPEMKPEQLKTVLTCNDGKKDHLAYRQGEIVTVLDRMPNSNYWRGVLNNGKTGLFNPANTVAHIDSLPSSTNRDSFVRTLERSSRRKLKTDMISSPQNDLKHTGHVGIDGAYFGDVAFLSNPQNYNQLPRQIVTPYKPSEDLEEQTPLLLPPTPTSPDSTQTASGYFSEATNLIMNANEHAGHGTNDNLSFDFRQTAAGKEREPSTSIFNESNPFAHSDSFHANDHQLLTHKTQPFTIGDNFVNLGDNKLWSSNNSTTTTSNNNNSGDQQDSHEYHEISDDEIHGDKFDLGPSLLDEMDHMFRSMTSYSGSRADGSGPPLSPDFENVNKRNELTELNSKLARKSGPGNSGNIISGTSYKSKKKATTVKPISHKDEKILNHAIEIANEISARSMTDLVADSSSTAQSPKRKFSFRFPNLTHSSHEKDSNAQQMNGASTLTHQSSGHSSKERKNFSEEVKNVPDLQSTLTEDHRIAYKSLVDDPKELLKLRPKDTLDDEERTLAAGSVSTLPRSSFSNVESQNLCQNNRKSATLSKILGRSKENQESSSSPLKILRDRNFPIVKPRLRILPSVGSESINSTTLLLDNDGESMCESPSYLQHPQYTFSQKEIEQAEATSSKSQLNNNPLPLPPRDRNAPLPSSASQKRHVRKYPLIIPATGLQRTLNKVNQVTPVEEKTDVFPIPAIVKPQNQDPVDDDDDDVFTYDVPKPQDFRKSETILNDVFEYDVPKCHELREAIIDDNVDQASCSKYEKNYTKDFIENNFPISETTGDESGKSGSKSIMHDSILSRNSSIFDDQRTYENLEFFQNQMKDDGADTASLHFESILENDDNMIALSPIPDDMVDGFNLFNVEKENSKLPQTSSPLSSAEKLKSTKKFSIEVKRQEFSQKFPKYKMPKNELASNALFNKIKESVEMANARKEEEKSSDEEKECDLKKSINHVSCEDLLDFSDKKPKGKERGLESDEMRILTKVLGNSVNPEKCLETLDFIEWDVHKAIKLCKLQNLFSAKTLQELFDDLEKNDWDLNQTTNKIHQNL